MRQRQSTLKGARRHKRTFASLRHVPRATRGSRTVAVCAYGDRCGAPDADIDLVLEPCPSWDLGIVEHHGPLRLLIIRVSAAWWMFADQPVGGGAANQARERPKRAVINLAPDVHVCKRMQSARNKLRQWQILLLGIPTAFCRHHEHPSATDSPRLTDIDRRRSRVEQATTYRRES